MAARVKARITPEVLLWARESSGFTLEQAAKSASVKPEKVASWERGEDQPTIRQLRLLANKYKRPIAVFYLPAPPKDFQALRDFRRLPGQVATPESPALRLEVRRAQFRRDVAIDLFRELSEEPPTFGVVGDLSEEPEALAEAIRAALGITLGEQATWRQPYAILNGWRNRLEQAGVLVFQFSGVEMEEARGFSIADQPLPVVAVNIKDSPRGRVFSMLHELAHVALRRGGLCDFSTDAALPPESRSIEVFCNHVAGAVIGAGREPDVEAPKRWIDQAEDEAERALIRLGPRFVRLVLSAYDQRKISSSRVSDYLELGLGHLETVRGRLFGGVAA